VKNIIERSTSSSGNVSGTASITSSGISMKEVVESACVVGTMNIVVMGAITKTIRITSERFLFTQISSLLNYVAQ